MKTTDVGYVNKNEQENLGVIPDRSGDSNQKLYHVKCRKCGHEYGVNGCDLHERKCPKHGGGRSGAVLTLIAA